VAEKSYEARKAYIDACLSRSLDDFPNLTATTARATVARLDRAIITAGDRPEILLDLITQIQHKYLPVPHQSGPQPPDILFESNREPPKGVSAAGKPVPRLSSLPSFTSFHANGPFILPGYCIDWPAVKNWKSKEYLRSVAGPGRMVPVEVGHDYRTNDWTQKLICWDEFLDSLNSLADPVLYLAQHSLFMQFPCLRNDVFIPDYVYSAPDHSKDFPDYRPPANEDQLVINAWLGPKGTISPAHTVRTLFLLYQNRCDLTRLIGSIPQLLWLACPHSALIHPPILTHCCSPSCWSQDCLAGILPP